MLVATHENANVWFLFSGDRGVIDALLNKPMFTPVSSNFTKAFAQYLRLTHTLQLGCMTYAAAQKGWEGLSLLVLVIVNYLLRFRYRPDAISRRWLVQNGIEVDVNSFEFSGRTIMLGAVQAYSGSETTKWMDEILIPHPRRDAFLTRIRHPEQVIDEVWSSHDSKAIVISSDLANVAAKLLRACNKRTV